MTKRAMVVSLALSLGLLAGCIQVRDEYTLNPDGSGKVKVDRLEPAAMNMMGGSKDLNPEAEALKVAKKLVEKTKGVEAWKDVTWKIAEDGRVRVTGTAYFKDINALAFSSKEGRTSLEKPGDGRMVLRFGKQGAKPKTATKTEPAKLSDEELKRKVLVEKVKWQQGRGMMVATMSGMLMESTYNLPGKVEKTSCFKKLGAGKVRFTIKGDDFIKTLDRLTADEKFWKAQAAGSNRGSLKDFQVPEALKMLYGSTEPPCVEVSGAVKPLFNYAEEVAAARKGMPDLVKKLGAKPPSGTGGTGSDPEPEPAKAGDGLVKVWITSINQTLAADLPKDKGLWPPKATCEIQVIGQLPGKVIKIEDGKLEKAVADNDGSMMPAKSFYQKTQGAYLQGTKKDFVKFSLRLGPLPEGAKAIKEASGHLVYYVGSGSKKTDLGEIKLEKDASGKVLGAKVTRRSKNFGSVTLELAIKDPSMIKGVTCKTTDDKELQCKVSNAYTWSGKTRLSLSIPRDAPETAKFELELYEKTEKRNMPFKLENVKVR